MIRSLKVLGDFSLAQFDRGLPHLNPDIEAILKFVPQTAEDRVTYEGLYYRFLSTQIDSDLGKLQD